VADPRRPREHGKPHNPQRRNPIWERGVPTPEIDSGGQNEEGLERDRHRRERKRDPYERGKGGQQSERQDSGHALGRTDIDPRQRGRDGGKDRYRHGRNGSEASAGRQATGGRPHPMLIWPATRFVAGESKESAIAAVRDLNTRGISGSLDLLGENVTDREAATRAREDYVALLRGIADAGVDSNISIKLTMLGLDIERGIADHLVSILDAPGCDN
jgi:hypothetical protein